MSPEQAMTAPIACRGTSCKQGRKVCTSPMKCSGTTFEADSSVARIKASIPRYPELPVSMDDEPAGGLVLAILGVLSSLGLVLLAWLVYTAWRWWLP